MKQAFDDVIALQKAYSSKNTPEMSRRGLLIRNTIPAEIEKSGALLRKAMGISGADSEAEGGDGTGRKTLVPWARWYSLSRSSSAQRGWYVVYLFHPRGEGVSLCLSHGSTELKNGTYVERSREEVAKLMGWAADLLGSEFADYAGVGRGVTLGGGSLATAYERTTLFSKFYSAGTVPNEEALRTDLLRFCTPLRKIYDAQDMGHMPGAPEPAVRAAEAEAERAAAPRRRSGQSFGLSAAERKAVELRAMEVAKEWLREGKFDFKDVSAKDCCDFRAFRAGEEWVIEVKGTTCGPSSVLITRNELALHHLSHPRNALLVVHGIELRRGEKPVANGGQLRAISPWLISKERLVPISYEYHLPD
jgi:hypothetical protein